MLMNERQGLPRRPSEAEFYVAAASAALFGPSRKAQAGGLWAMLSVYFDESGTHPGSPVWVIAGLVASPARWERFTAAWQKILDDSEIPEFYMKHFAHSVGPFQGWGKEKGNRLIRRLIPLVKRTAPYRVWTAVVMDDYRAMIRDVGEKQIYSLCAFGCASRLKWLARSIRSDLFIPYMFERGGKGSSKAFGHFSKLDPTFYNMGPLSVGQLNKVLPLQAADLHAYEVHKYFADQVVQSNRGIRGSFRELLAIPDAGGYLLTYDKLKALMHGMKAQGFDSTESIPIPLDPLNLKSRVELILDTDKRGPFVSDPR